MNKGFGWKMLAGILALFFVFSYLGTSISRAGTESGNSNAGRCDLGNPEFGYVDDIVLPDSIDNMGELFSMEFGFHVYDAESFSDGHFTYTLPAELDFASMKGVKIQVNEEGENIGYAEIGDDNVITFVLDPESFVDKPNGIDGHVGITCKLGGYNGADGGKATIHFSETYSADIVVNNSVVTATKDPIVLSNGRGKFTVVFEVLDTTSDFEAVDVLGNNLVFEKGQYTFSGNGTLELVDDHTLKVKADVLEAGTYYLEYWVEVVKEIDTGNLSYEEIISSGFGNTVNWNFKGALGSHEIKSFAQSSVKHYIRKEGTDNLSEGIVRKDGTCDWYVYVNGGAHANNMSGITYKDVLDERMDFENLSIVIMRSTDSKNWEEECTLSADNFYYNEDGQHCFAYTFPNSSTNYYYSVSYQTRIKGELPVNCTKYYNHAYLFRGDVELATTFAINKYNHYGNFGFDISKGVVKDGSGQIIRNAETGEVGWKTVFEVSGQRKDYSVEFSDVISSTSGSIEGKSFGAVIDSSSVKIFALDDNGEPYGEEIPLENPEFGDSGSFSGKISKLAPGRYVMTYTTYDYFGDPGTHVFPGGSDILFRNVIQMTIDGSTVSAEDVYEVNSTGLPMTKRTGSSYYDNARGLYIIPWNIVVNRNNLSQFNDMIVGGTSAEVIDYLPEHLVYLDGSTTIRRSSTALPSIEPVVSAEDGKTKLVWNFTWDRPEGTPKDKNYYVISFETCVEKSYFEQLVNGTEGGVLNVSFANSSFANVGGNIGASTCNSVNKIEFLVKDAVINEETGIIDYSVTINKAGLTLLNGSELKFVDKLENGTLIKDSIKLCDFNTQEEIALSADAVSINYAKTSFTMMIPDARALVVKYQVKPNVYAGEKLSQGKVRVPVNNTASLIGESNKSTTHSGKFDTSKISADITSNKGSITIYKVDAMDLLRGLNGAQISLYKVNLDDGSAEEVSCKSTDGDFSCVTFNSDGKYNSLIFDVLYYYQEKSAPSGYIADDSKHYFVFKSGKYSQRKEQIEQIVGEEELTLIDVGKGNLDYEFTLTNRKEAEPEPKPEVNDDTPVTPTTPSEPSNPSEPSGDDGNNDGGNDSSEGSSQPSDNPPALSKLSFAEPTPDDLPEVLGVYDDEYDEWDIPEVLGARSSRTADRDMTPSYIILILAVALTIILIRYKNNNYGD